MASDAQQVTGVDSTTSSVDPANMGELTSLVSVVEASSCELKMSSKIEWEWLTREVNR